MLYPFETATREVRSLNGIWNITFDKKREGVSKKFFNKPPSDLIEVAVPGSVNEQINDREQYNNMDWLWYFREFTLGNSWKGKRLSIRFGSVNFRAEVFLNGVRLGDHEGGYMPFEFDITNIISFDKPNRLAVRVDNLLSETTIPQGNLDPAVGGVAQWRVGNFPNVHYDFFPFTGIHRNVDLVATNDTRLEKIRLNTESVKGKQVHATAEVEVSGKADSVLLKIPALKFEQELKISRNKGKSALRLNKVIPWSPKNPKLYDIIFETKLNGETVDIYNLPFGFRTVKTTKNDILINGKPVFLRGMGRHEDTAIAGKGLNLPYLIKDYQNLKWIGANSFRTSHYPYSEEDMFMADRMGIMVIDEVAANTISMCAIRNPKKRTELLKNHNAQISELITRDYNHPAVIMWSLGNECESNDRDATKYFPKLVKHAKSIDNSRPVTIVQFTGVSDKCAQHYDVICCNTYPSWYVFCGQYEKIPTAIKDLVTSVRKKFGKPIIISEFGADTIPGLHSSHSLMWSEEYQVEMVERIIDETEKYPYVVGTHVWVQNDFKVGQHVGRIINNWKGIFTRDRQPKMIAHVLKKRWSK